MEESGALGHDSRKVGARDDGGVSIPVIIRSCGIREAVIANDDALDRLALRGLTGDVSLQLLNGVAQTEDKKKLMH